MGNHHGARSRRANPRPTWSNATSPRRRPIVCGSPTSATSQPGPAFFIWRWCSTRSAARSWAGRWKLICAPNWCSTALNMALGQRRPAAVIHHSDHGSQYTSFAFGKRCDEAGVRPSMGSVGDCFDNAMCESFFATLECELLDRAASKPRSKRAWRCSSSSKGGTTPIAATPRSTISRPSITNEHTPHNLFHVQRPTRKKTPRRRRLAAGKIGEEQETINSSSRSENHLINHQAQHRLLKRGNSTLPLAASPIGQITEIPLPTRWLQSALTFER